MPPKTRKTIDASGNLITVADGGPQDTATVSTTTSTSGWGGTGGGMLSSLQSGAPTIEVFGYNIPTRQFWMGALLIFLFFGLRSVFTMFMLLSIYNFYRRTTAASANSGVTTNGGGTWGSPAGGASSGSGGSGGGNTLGGGSGGGGGRTLGSNVRGISDLPRDPKVG